ncbi:MAG: hypothetical protein DK306_001058 [Chloroflexi bacterium]|jgi:hypothetical protein|nr:MAG: hypothetical protein DK306_001058 [Chloroflexota bacterium]
MPTVELNVDESWELMSFIVSYMLEDVEIGKADRAKIRRWKTNEMRTASEDMRALGEKVNADIARLWEVRRKSELRKPDWR